MPYAWLLVFLLLVHLFISGPLQKGSGISNEGYSLGIHSFDKVSAREFCLELLSSSEIFFLNFFFHLDGVSLQEAQIFERFFFSEHSNLVVPFRQSCVVCHFSLLALHSFLYQIPFLCPDCIFLLRVFEFSVFFIFCKGFVVVHVH